MRANSIFNTCNCDPCAVPGGVPASAARLGFCGLPRDPGMGEPLVSRPPHKQQATVNQKSGKGLVDLIMVRVAAPGAAIAAGVGGEAAMAVTMGQPLERDSASRRALLLSHGRCAETGEWPSDHGLEALTVHVQ